MCDEFLSMINKVLPPEMLKKVLEMLDIKSLCYARQTCQHWKLIIDNCNIMKDLLGRITCTIVFGGGGSTTVEVITGDLGTKQLPNLPDDIEGSSMVLHNGTMLFCGGFYNFQKCLQLDHGTWKEHSTLNTARVNHSAVTTKTATFLFGGDDSRTTYEYLPNDQHMA